MQSERFTLFVLVCNNSYVYRGLVISAGRYQLPGRQAAEGAADFNIVNSKDALLVRVMNFGIVLRFFGFNPSGMFTFALLVFVTLIIKKCSAFFRVRLAFAGRACLVRVGARHGLALNVW